MRGSALAVVTVVLVVMAGCGGKPAPPTQTSSVPPPGAIVGRVLDDASSPIAGANIRVLLTQRSATTDAEGAFAIQNVPSGPIRVVASADGFTSQTKSANLPANGNLTLNFLLAGVPRIEPRVETSQFSGRIVCGLYLGAACPADPTEDPEQVAVVHPFEVAFDLRGIVFELDWEPPASGVNENLAFDVHAASPDGCGERYNGALGPSTLRLEVLEGFPVSGGNQCVIVRPPGNQATAQQDFTMYVTLFYHEPPPPGFSVLPPSGG